jgi:uncharacterized protein
MTHADDSEPLARPTSVVRVVDQVRQRWTNDGGWTREIARQVSARQRSGHSNTTASWDWRISIAEIETDGPFSTFPNCDRTLLLLAGHGMRLGIAGENTEFSHPLDRITFPGEAHVECELINGPTTDFNVMWNRTTTTAQVFHRLLGGNLTLQPLPDETWALHLLEGAAAGPTIGRLEPGDTLIATTDQTLMATGNALLIRFSPVTKPNPTQPNPT